VIKSREIILDLDPAPLGLEHDLNHASGPPLLILGAAEIIPTRISVALEIKTISAFVGWKILGSGPRTL